MMRWLSRYTWALWGVLALVIVGIVLLLVALFGLPGRGTSAFSAGVTRNIQSIYRRGLAMGNRPDVFSKVGDSITASSSYLKPIGDGSYDLDEFGYLQATIEHYSTTTARTGNSFNNLSLAAKPGWSAQGVLLTDYANPEVCQPGEIPLVCEYHTTKPSIALIMLGSNDVAYRPLADYIADMQQIIDISVEMGVIPVISTIPYRADFADKVAAYNDALRELTSQNNVPLWDYAAALQDVPERGLSVDGLHPSAPPWDQQGGAAQFTAESLNYGFTVRNLTALQMLHAVRGAVT
jgi:hypothetical protein